MLGRSKQNGDLFALYPWHITGAKYCGGCGKRLGVGEWYTRHQVFHPLNGNRVYIAQCGTCFPVEVVAEPGKETPIDYRETKMEIPTVRENTPYPSPTTRMGAGELYDESSLRRRTPEGSSTSRGTLRFHNPIPPRFGAQYGWQRRRPEHIDEVLTQEFVVERGLRKALRRVLG